MAPCGGPCDTPCDIPVQSLSQFHARCPHATSPRVPTRHVCALPHAMSPCSAHATCLWNFPGRRSPGHVPYNPPCDFPVQYPIRSPVQRPRAMSPTTPSATSPCGSRSTSPCSAPYHALRSVPVQSARAISRPTPCSTSLVQCPLQRPIKRPRTTPLCNVPMSPCDVPKQCCCAMSPCNTPVQSPTPCPRATSPCNIPVQRPQAMSPCNIPGQHPRAASRRHHLDPLHDNHALHPTRHRPASPRATPHPVQRPRAPRPGGSLLRCAV